MADLRFIQNTAPGWYKASDTHAWSTGSAAPGRRWTRPTPAVRSERGACLPSALWTRTAPRCSPCSTCSNRKLLRSSGCRSLVASILPRTSSAVVPAAANPRSQVGFFEKREHPTEGTYLSLRHPVRFSKTPAVVLRDPPKLGQDTSEVLGELGFSPQEIETLTRKKEGAVAEKNF